MRRSGATLIEVLVAIFVMGVGLIALLVLFPLGALRMAQAIQDEYCAQAAANADAVGQFQGIRNGSQIIVPLVPDPFNNPGGGLTPADPDGPSYAVLVDPSGWRAMSFQPGAARDWVGTDFTSRVRRARVGFADPTKPWEIYRWFSLLDDINFDVDGLPKKLGAGTPPPIERDIRYTWAYLCQRPRSADVGAVNYAIVVYNRRQLSPNSALTLNEYPYTNAVYDTSRSTVTIDFTGLPAPPVRPGDWILDTTVDNSKAPLTPHAFFYRVVSVNDISATQVELEVQTPLRGFQATRPPIQTAPGATTYVGSVVVFEGIAEVFERGLGR
ncbi:MAG: prepilin-type N-terminal cleavage/methylation domain-containing protein [Planctomycetes bacterium]|nr:prepilin-type N-terminal cleavage/methylation domain-containing protein [Planctomycetota bacterium]